MLIEQLIYKPLSMAWT